jgi:CBS domain-containing protein
MINLKEWMSHKIISCSEEDFVFDAVKKMAKHSIGCLIVEDSDRVQAGILTERDVMLKLVAKDKNPKYIRVKEIMTKDVITISYDSSLLELSQTMKKYKLRRIPVTKDGIIIGIITSWDLIRIMSGES